MARFRIDILGDLARQMTFTPVRARQTQLQSAEELLFSIDPLKAYPVEYVIFRITGYHPKTADQNLLAGLALQHDLGQLIETVSDSLDLRVEAIGEPVLQIDDVCERFNVTSKTIQRWRRRGLAARRFIFGDGKRRVGFMLTSVERFLAAHREQVGTTANFTQVSDAERDAVVRKATILARGGASMDEIARRVSRKVNRSPLTIQHLLRKHDTEHPAAAIDPIAGVPISDAERARILKGHRKGVAIRRLARRIGRRRTAIYRILLQDRLDRLAERRVKFIDDPLYHQVDAEAVVNAIVAAEPLSADFDRAANRIPRDLPPYLAELYRTPLLTAAKERALFLKLNFHKWQFVSARRKLDASQLRLRDLARLEGFLAKAVETKNAIVRANLRLVVSVARKHLRGRLSLMELVSDGNLTLMRAVESFDAHRGHRFSTYASLALMKGFARSVPLMLAARALQPADDATLTDVADPRGVTESARIVDRDHVRQLLAILEPREREVLLAHYGIGEDGSDVDALSRRLGLSRQRVRQIERKALAKLRAAMNISAA
jgi:RNA polymerase primary sigma factor